MNDNSWFTHYFIKVNLRSIHNIYITKLVNCGGNVNSKVDAFDKIKTYFYHLNSTVCIEKKLI